jgi:IS5 family transposase
VFIGLPLGDASPDHSVISRFRDRVGSKVMELVHANLLGQLQEKGFSIDAGLAVDARLVRSVFSPMSKDKLEEKRQEQRKQDKSKEPMKCGRGLESDWTKRMVSI